MARGPRGPNRSTLRKRIESLSETYEPRMRRAFLEAIEDVVSRAELGRIIEAMERGDINAAIRAMHLDPAAFRILETTKAQAFEAGGRATTEYLPALRTPTGDRMVIRFDIRNPRAEAYLSGRSSTLISNAGGLSDRLFAEQVSTLRTAMTNGLQAGRNPRSVALDLIGRVDRTTGRRVGGSIGLSNPQQAAVERARAALLSGDKKAMKQYLTLQRRDRRFDAMVNRAIADGKAVSPEMVDRAIGRYSDRLLQLRGETIARTEIQGALAKSKEEAFRQAIDSGALSEGQVQKVWIATKDARTRDTHRAIDGERVPLNQPFSNGLMYPHAEGAPASEVVNCFAPWSRIAVAGIKGAIAHRYSGELVELSLGVEVKLAVTPNHPVLTQRGWIAAGLVNEGDKLIQCLGLDHRSPEGAEANITNVYARADEVYRAAHALGRVERAGGRIVNLHGYVPDEDIDIVSLDVPLWGAVNSALRQKLDNLTLAQTDLAEGAALYQRMISLGNRSRASRSNGGMSCSGPFSAILRGVQCCRKSISLGHSRSINAEIIKAFVHNSPADADLLGNSEHGITLNNKFGNALKVLKAVGSSAFSGSPAFDQIALPLREFRDSQIAQARNHDGSRNAKFCGNGGTAHLLEPALPYRFMMLFARLLPAFRVTRFARSHHPLGKKNSSRRGVRNIGAKRRAIDSFSGEVKPPHLRDDCFVPVKVTASRRFHHDGLVYDFETVSGLIIADEVISHNCRCTFEHVIDYFEDLD